MSAGQNSIEWKSRRGVSPIVAGTKLSTRSAAEGTELDRLFY